MQKNPPVVWMALLLGPLVAGCGSGWVLDYGEPAAQFLATDLASGGATFVGEKVTVKGIVTKIDTFDAGSAWIHLQGGIRCDLGNFATMAEGCEVGETAFVDGILERCEEGNILLSPAVLRDPEALFSPR